MKPRTFLSTLISAVGRAFFVTWLWALVSILYVIISLTVFYILVFVLVWIYLFHIMPLRAPDIIVGLLFNFPGSVLIGCYLHTQMFNWLILHNEFASIGSLKMTSDFVFVVDIFSVFWPLELKQEPL